jgi:hypothetical protein
MASEKQRENEGERESKERSRRPYISFLTPNDLLPPARPYLLKFSSSPRRAIIWRPSLQHMRFGRHLRSQNHNTY